MLTLVLALGLSGALLTARSATAADFTWTGAAPAGEPNWSNGSNWSSGAPSGTVGTLTFPVVGCQSGSQNTTCYQSANNITGITATALDFTASGYNLTGGPITLGAGGLSFTSEVSSGLSIALPINLGVPQTWTLNGGSFDGQAELTIEAPVTGSSDALKLNITKGQLTLFSRSEESNTTIQRAFGGSTVFSNGAALPARIEAGAVTVEGGGVNLIEGNLNGYDAHPVQFVNSALYGNGATGPLTLAGTHLGPGFGGLQVEGDASIDSGSEVALDIFSPLASSTVRATGHVTLSEPRLALYGECSPTPGQVYTLVSATGGVSGKFAGVPNGGLVYPIGDGCSLAPPVRINYTAHSVTATVADVEPYGGALTLLELLAGGQNPSEFCPACFMGKLISFFQPVDAPTGNFWHTFDDLSVPGRGIPLDLTRTYNSMSAATAGPFGFGWSFPYNMSLSFPDATHVVVNQENGSQVIFTEQSGGVYTAPPRVTAKLVHNGDGSWTFVRRHKDTFSFDSNGRMTQEKDLNGYVTALAYNGSGQLTTVTDPAGRKLTFAYSGNHISSATDPLGRVASYAYDGEGNLTNVTDVNGGNTHFTYDSAHRMLTMRFPNQAPGVPGSTGAVVSNKYDGQGRVIEQTDQLGRTTKFAYSGEPLGEAGGTTTITDPKGNVIVQNYQFGELLSETKGYGTEQAATWSFGYDPATLGMTSVTDPNGHTTTSTFDSEGNTLTMTDALGRTTTNTYDSLNDLLTTTDPLAVTTTMTYDAHGNLLGSSRPLNGTSEVQTTTYTYGDGSHPGDVTAMTDPEGKTWKYTYDAYGDRTSTTNPLGDEPTSTYNAIGWVLSTTSPRGNASGADPASFTTTYAHNNFGQVTETVDPLGHKTTSQYDPEQNLIASTDADGNTTTYTYDAADEQTAVHRADGTTSQTTYWPDGTVKEQIDGAGHATHYEYDPLGRVSAVTDPLGRTTLYGYDLAGNRITVTDPEGRVTTKAYDAANEPTSITYSDGKTPNVTGITYDADGERTGETDGSGAWSWTWDSLHRLTSVIEGNNGAVKYQYDLHNNPTMITYPNGHSVTRGYDAAGRWTSVTDWLGNTTTFAYDADGNMATETLPAGTGITDRSTYGNDDALSSINDKQGANTLFAANYTRDANRQLTGDSSQPESEGAYGYTALNQLCYAGKSAGSCGSPPSGATQYQYDSANNLTKMGATTQTLDAADELTGTSTPSSGGHGEEHEPTPEPSVIHNEPHPHINILGFHEERVLPSVTSGKVAFAHTNGHGGVVSQLVSTSSAKDLVLAFVSAKEPRGGGQGVAGIKGGRLKWTPVTSGSFSGGYVSVWQTKAPKPLKHMKISVKLRTAGLPAALAVVGFDSGASVVTSARASRKTGATTISTTVPAGANVWAVGQDALGHSKLKPLTGQTIVAKINAPGNAISWLQSGAPPSAGRLVLGDSTPMSSSWALGAVVIQERAGTAAKIARRAAPSLTGAPEAGDNTSASLTSVPSGAVEARSLTSSTNETTTFSYDAEGDRAGLTTSNGTAQTYAYNQALELTGIGNGVSYAYSGDGLRMSKTVGATTTPFTWDAASGLPLVLEDGTNAYVYGPRGLPLEQVTGNTALGFHHDQLGSTRLLTNAAGQTVATYTYTPYGGLSSSSGTASTPLLYAGQYRDSESGLYYLRARYYDPSTGQFLTRDPLEATTRSPYAYVTGNPLNRVDPSGEIAPWELSQSQLTSLMQSCTSHGGAAGQGACFSATFCTDFMSCAQTQTSLLQAAFQASAQAGAEENTCEGNTLRAVSNSLFHDAAIANISLAYYGSEDKRLLHNINEVSTGAFPFTFWNPVTDVVFGASAFGSWLGQKVG